MRIAVIGDIHQYRLYVPPWYLLGKRLLGQCNLWLNRRHSLDPGLLDQLIEQVAHIEPDMLLLPGDLTTTAFAGEFEDIAARLSPLTSRIPTVAVPGNHDRYTFTSARRRVMEHMLPGIVPDRWPHFRSLTDRWFLLALDAAVPRIMNSRGQLGREQLRHVRSLISKLTDKDGLVVLCHYPLKNPPRALPLTWDHKLADDSPLKKMLIDCPARILYVHGHIHRPWCWQPRHSDQSHFTYLNAGAPCMISNRHPSGQGFWHVDLPHEPQDHMRIVHYLPDGRPVDGASPVAEFNQGWVARAVA
jgi:3',5'-cyclic AMP phosphodiesterase CpdA